MSSPTKNDPDLSSFIYPLNIHIIMKVLSTSERVCKLVTKENLYLNKHINFQVLCRELAYETPLQLSLLKELIEQFKRLLGML